MQSLSYGLGFTNLGPMIRLWMAGIAMVATLCGQGQTTQELKAKFAEAIRPADRVVIRRVSHDSGQENWRIVFDHTDPLAVAGLVAGFEPTELSDDVCLCLPTTTVEFFSGDEFVYRFGVIGPEKLKSQGARFWGELNFSKEKGRGFLRQFETMGYRGFAEEWSQADARAAVSDAEWADLLALFPPKARAAVPRGRSIEELLGERTAGPRLREALGEDSEAVLIVWRALGLLVQQRGLSVAESSRQPCRTFEVCLSAMPESTQAAAIERLEKIDDSLTWAGASFFLLLRRNGENPWAVALNEDLLVRLVDALFLHVDSLWREREMVEVLANYPQPAVSARLRERLWTLVSGETMGTADPAEDTEDRAGRIVALVLGVARREDPEALPLLEELRGRYENGWERLALDVGIALRDPTQSHAVGEPHLSCEVAEIADAALAVIQGEGRELPLRVLMTLARGPEPDPGDAPEEIEFLPPTNSRSWARAELANIGLEPIPWPRNREPSPAEKSAEALLQSGRYEEAYQSYTYDVRVPSNPLDGFKAMLGAGRLGEAIESQGIVLGAAIRGVGDEKPDDALGLRGVVSFANGYYASAAKDFAAAAQIADSDDEWWLAMEYIALAHAGREMEAGLKDWSPYVSDPTEGPARIWSNVVLLFLLGEVDEQVLLESAGASLARKAPFEISKMTRSHWLLAEQARLAGDSARERAHLAEVLALKDFENEIYLLARLRERELRWAELNG